MHDTDVSSRLRFEKVCDPEHPLKLCPIVSEVTLLSTETVNAMDAPCAVVPLHSPLSPVDGATTSFTREWKRSRKRAREEQEAPALPLAMVSVTSTLPL